MRGSCRLLAAGRNGLDRRSISRYDWYGAPARTTSARGAQTSSKDESRYPAQLLYRNRHFPARRKGLLGKAKPNGVLYVLPGSEAKFLAPLDVREIPGVGKVTEQKLHAVGIRKVNDLTRFGDAKLEDQFGKWGLALAGKARGEDAGAWFEAEIGADEGAKSISH